jgi:four helix bundle protein
MSENRDRKPYALEERTFLFTKDVIEFVGKVPKGIANNEVAKQLVRSAGSVGANYIEANEALSKKDFLMRAKICRKEAKESGYWIRLLTVPDSLESTRAALLQESMEMLKIFSSIVEKSGKK